MEENIELIFVICLSMIAGAITGIILYSDYSDNCMTPMDVYQGKITIEYKVVDGVKVDSTVVWKNN